MYAEGMVAYALKQEALFRDIAERARKAETASKVARGKKRPRAPILDPLQDAIGRNKGDEAEEEDDGDDDAVLWEGADDGDGDEEQGVIESDEELVMGGEVDDI
jgi:hypothetical protein